jgi:hypothetical protein
VDLTKFNDFFDCCVGQWTTERTYHYLTYQEVERSRTEFQVEAISLDLKQKVLADNHYETPGNLEQMPGFRLFFHTVSEKGEEVSQELRALFIPQQRQGDILIGDYLRDQAYEEARPIISAFRYDESQRELLMTTSYTRVISVDSIILVNPTMRIRRILNYQRPVGDEPMETLVLAGFGVEQKVT